MRVLGPVVLPTLGDPPVLNPDLLQGGAVGAELVGDQLFGSPVPIHKLLVELERCLAISSLGDERFKHFALMVHRPQEVLLHAIDLHEHLILSANL